MRRPALLLLVDLAAVVLFAVIGRTSHAEDLTGTLATAAPFVLGAAVGAGVGRTWREPLAWRAGAATWVGAVVVGLTLRWALRGTLPVSFAIVATVALGVLVLGWRGVARLVPVVRRRDRRPA